jgi:hypothetical protein
MIKALLLVFVPAATWERIVLARRSWPTILLIYLLPLWILAGVAEGYGMVHWGKPQGEMAQLLQYPCANTLVFQILQLLLMLAVVVICAWLIEAFGETFHARHTFKQTFTVCAYGLGPLFAIRVLDIFPGVSGAIYWVTWLVGILLCLGTLYHGIPLVMQPDPPHAFGLYVTSSVLLILVTGFVRFLTYWYLSGNFRELDALISKIVEHMPLLQSFNNMHF